MAADVGDVWEDALEEAFKLLNNECLMQWHAFPDTKRSGGGAISNQPSDYLVGLPIGSDSEQRMMFVEAKASEKHNKLQKAAIRPGQRGFIHRWRMMLQLPYYIFFYSTVSGELQIWDGAGAAGNRLKAEHKLAAWKVGAGREVDARLAADHIKRFFDLPDKSKAVESYRRLDA